jgi:Lrp/AsnC family transcriptional regulator, leucine-responsive regulatory protein
MSNKLDKIDLTILKKLQEDGRMTNLQLSQEIGLSPAPTLERVRKLEKTGFIKSYHAVVNEEELGIGIKAIIQVSLTRQIENAIQSFVNCGVYSGNRFLRLSAENHGRKYSGI